MLFLLLACQLGSMPAYAQTHADAGKQQCPPAILAAVGEHAGVSGLSHPRRGLDPGTENGGLVVASACKAWPGDRTRTIAAVAYDAAEKEKGLLVALIGTPARASGPKVIAAYSGTIQEDAAMTVGPDSLRIDTARYQLAPGVRAFGLDLSNSFSQGCGSGGWGPARTLFVQEGKSIRPVLEALTLSSWRYARGGPSCVDPQEDESIETTDYSIAVGKPVRHGFASLRITATVDDDATPKRHRPPLSVDLHYDGTRYPTPTSDDFR